MRNLFYIIGFILLFSTCAKVDNKTIIYTVKSGNHYSNNRNYSTQPDEIYFNFTVNNSWYWRDGLSKSKVYGLYWKSPEKNSVRLATKVKNGEINLYMFVHSSGSEPITIPIGIVNTGVYYCSIGYDTDSFYLYFNGRTYYADAPNGLKGPKLSLPYIGGDYTIKNDFNVKITRL